MTELVEDVLPWFVALYIFDAVIQLRRGQVVLTRLWPFEFQLRGPGLQIAGLMPWSIGLIAHDLPVLPTTDGVWVFDPQARNAPAVVRSTSISLVPWHLLADLRADGSVVKGAQRVLFRACTPRATRALASDLVRVRESGRERVEIELEHVLTRGFDLSAVRSVWNRVRLPILLASCFGSVEAFILFGVIPVVTFTSWSANAAWGTVLLALAAAHLGVVLSSVWAMVRKGAGFGEAVHAIAPLVVFPPFAVRAGSHLARDAFVQFEPMALGAALLPTTAFLRLARREWVRIAESQSATDSLGLAAYWSARRRAVEGLLSASGTSVRAVLLPPPLEDGTAAWCPLCTCEYRPGFARCADCDLALVPR